MAPAPPPEAYIRAPMSEGLRRRRALRSITVTSIILALGGSLATLERPGETRQEHEVAGPITWFARRLIQPVAFITKPFRIRRVVNRRKKLRKKAMIEQMERQKEAIEAEERLIESTSLVPSLKPKKKVETIPETLVASHEFIQEVSEIKIKVVVTTLRRVKSKDVRFDIKPNNQRLHLSVFGQTVLNATLYSTVQYEDVFWELQTQEDTGYPTVLITMPKTSNMYWPQLWADHTNIYTSKWQELNKIALDLVGEGTRNWAKDTGHPPDGPAFNDLPTDVKRKYMDTAKLDDLHARMEDCLSHMTREEREKLDKFYRRANSAYQNPNEKEDSIEVEMHRPPGVSKAAFEAAKQKILNMPPEERRRIIMSKLQGQYPEDKKRFDEVNNVDLTTSAVGSQYKPHGFLPPEGPHQSPGLPGFEMQRNGHQDFPDVED